MSEIDAKYIGLTANRLAELATKLERYNTLLREENERLIKLNAILDDIEAENARLRSLLREAFDGVYTYGSECTRYGVDAVAYNWKHWSKENGIPS